MDWSGTGGRIAKSRLVVQGFRDPHLPILMRDAPVLSRVGLTAILQVTVSYRWRLWNADAKSAFLQGRGGEARAVRERPRDRRGRGH